MSPDDAMTVDCTNVSPTPRSTQRNMAADMILMAAAVSLLPTAGPYGYIRESRGIGKASKDKRRKRKAQRRARKITRNKR